MDSLKVSAFKVENWEVLAPAADALKKSSNLIPGCVILE